MVSYKCYMNQKNRKIILYIFIGIVISMTLFLTFLKSGRIHYGNVIQKYKDTEVYGSFSNREVTIEKGDVFKQELTNGNGTIYSFSIKYHTELFEKGTELNIKLYDQQTDKELQHWVEKGTNIEDDGFSEYRIDKRAIKNAQKYYITIESNKKCGAIYCSQADSLNGAVYSINGEEQSGDIILRLSQTKYVANTQFAGICLSLAIGFGIVAGFYFDIFRKALKKIKQFVMSLTNEKQLIIYLKNILMILLLLLFGIVLEKMLAHFDVLEYNTVGAFNEYRCVFIIACLMCIYITIIGAKKADKKSELIALLLLGVIGIMYVMIIPAESEMSWDESIHYWNAVGVSHPLSGYANKAEEWLYWHSGIGYGLPNSIDALRISQNSVQNLYNMGQIVAGNTDVWTKISCIAYVPAAVGLAIGRGLHLPYVWTFHLGAAMNMVLYLILAYFSMKKLKSGKMILVTVTGLTTAMFLAGVYSLDSWITGFTMLGLATFFETMQKPKLLSIKNMVIMLGSFSLGFLPKTIYCPLFLLFLMIPENRFINHKIMRKFRVTTLALFVTFLLEMVLSFKLFLVILAASWLLIDVCYLVWGRMTRKQKIIVGISLGLLVVFVGIFAIYYILPNLLEIGDLRGGKGVNSAEQVKFILSNPWKYTKILMKYLFTNYLYFGGAFKVIFGTFGYIGESSFQLISFGLLLIVAFTDKNAEDSWKEYNKVKIAMIVLVIIIIILIATALYISFTPVAFETINGCQPRYLIPLMFGFFALIGSNKWKNKLSLKIYNSAVMAMVAALLLANAWQVVVRLYY